MAFEQIKYQNEYNKEKYDRCIFNVPKGQKKVIEEHWRKRGFKSLNAYVVFLIERDMQISQYLEYKKDRTHAIKGASEIRTSVDRARTTMRIKK